LVKTAGRTELVTNGNEFLIGYDPKTGKELWRTTGVKSHAIATPVIKGDIAILSSGASGNLDGTSNVLWSYNKGTAYVPSPILYDGLLYLMSDAGVLTCVEPETGKIVYEGGRVPVATKFYGASPVAFDGKILLTSDDGDTFVIKAGAKHEVLATNSLGESCRTSIAIADGRLFIRGEKHLYCISNGGKLARN
jgi:outer membrane protein assembly factor BamB